MGWEIEAWHLWLLAGMVLAAMEMLGLAFVALALGVSCIAGAVADLVGASLTVQIAATALMAILLTPLFVRWFQSRKGGDDKISLVGESGSGGQLCTLLEQQGRIGVKIKGDFFPAESSDGRELKVGQRVELQHFSGITAMVCPLNSDSSESDDAGKEP
ncbi:NfeD family protein [Motiliproteus coralliicola]|uniref:NfeD family protein n=1 Tax=Motiliproteus coralliicola TaxID=2283196 RepID=A0A369WEH7_9GAMM|nr:NfeD family protein [Motiliproteus coralliicola]RDE19693.1 NfeD family protein [Motiliproteus coralliicola]